MIDLSKQTKKVLQSRELLSALLAKSVDPRGLSSPTPIIQLVQSCPKQVHKKKAFELYCRIIENIELLLASGADVKELNTYHKGHETTPLHVATEMALIAGKYVQSITSLYSQCCIINCSLYEIDHRK